MPAPESPLALTRRARRIERVLAETYPDARCELDFDDPFQLLVVTVLSAQTTDKRVNAVRPTLFAAYPDAHAMAAADRETLFEGWMIASSPALMALDHPRYDVWALRCGAAPDEALPELTEAEAAAEEVAQETARPGDHAPETSLRPRPRP